jgi:hypothetical protein
MEVAAMQRQDAISRLHVGAPLHSSTDFSAFGAQPSREAFVEPKHKQSNRQHQHMPPP